eukprot:Plantae.Rhodophyta-Purpureofilum_apyrenoidigerum.ctg13734.p1 GENE.Plantae.Rhodophyta-Purpureofilum_apyrenoidigerum.ctg13734~~Plantae.Rhodophyta-Purpureofilum_apyrenoidigerum.ctg13734.p1  ORF type:complete len:1070 (+),score=220.81 Plantae.Rhodophyta-Purpureofilum_apyrenoidigerum.ctg13734:272-3481(+)
MEEVRPNGVHVEGVNDNADIDFDAEIEEDPKLLRGRLQNGLSYTLLPSTSPPDRVEAHLVVKCGSLDEEDHEQGLAHMVEHVVFCGTEALKDSDAVKAAMANLGMSFGADANASTDFRATKYTFHGPSRHLKEPTQMTDGSQISDGFEGVLQILCEICLRAKFREDAVNTERAAVLSELQLRNTVDFRSDKAFFDLIHGETRIPKRYPIGLAESVEKFTVEDVQRFYEKFYYPGNMELYCVGGFENEDAEKLIERVFGRIPRRDVDNERLGDKIESEHIFDRIDDSRNFGVFTHEHLPQAMVHFAVKVRRHRARTFDDLRFSLVDSICENVFEERMESHYRSVEDPIFTYVGWGFDEIYREGCAINSLMINCEASNYRAAIEITLKEAVRLYRYGVLQGEFDRALHMFLKALRQEAQQAQTKQSSSVIADLISQTELEDVFLSSETQYDLFAKAARTIDVSLVNRRLKAFFGGLGFQKNENYSADRWDQPVGPGECVIFVSAPSGKVISYDELQEVVELAKQAEIEEPKDIDLPEFLLEEPPESIPFVPMFDMEKKGMDISTPERPIENDTGIWFRALPNGIRGAFHVTTNDAKHFVLRINIRGGFSSMRDEIESAALSVGMSVLVSGGAAGYPSHLMSKYIMKHNIDVDAGVGMETVRVEFSAGTSGEGLMRAFELLYAFFTLPNWDEQSFERARWERARIYEEIQLDFERRTAEVSILDFFRGDRRFGSASASALQKVKLENVKRLVERVLQPSNFEVILVGDFDADEAEKHFATYLGGISASVVPESALQVPKIHVASGSFPQKISVYDLFPRASVIFTAALPGRWYIGQEDAQENTAEATSQSDQPSGETNKSILKSSPMFGARCLVILSEIINNRLYREVREQKMLTYWVNFSLTFMDTLSFSLFVIRTSPLADKVDEAIEAVKHTLNAITNGDFTQEEFRMALTPLVAQCESNMKLNSFWLNLCSGLTNPDCPKDASCIVNIKEAYSSLNVDDIKSYGCAQLKKAKMNITAGVTRPHKVVADFVPGLPKVLGNIQPSAIATAASFAFSVALLLRKVRKLRKRN